MEGAFSFCSHSVRIGSPVRATFSVAVGGHVVALCGWLVKVGLMLASSMLHFLLLISSRPAGKVHGYCTAVDA